jgi:hypothetical protein
LTQLADAALGVSFLMGNIECRLIKSEAQFVLDQDLSIAFSIPTGLGAVVRVPPSNAETAFLILFPLTGSNWHPFQFM